MEDIVIHLKHDQSIAFMHSDHVCIISMFSVYSKSINNKSTTQASVNNSWMFKCGHVD